MRALRVTPPASSVVTSVPDARPAAGAVVIRVRASAVNPVDVQTESGVYHDLGWIQEPTVGLGWDVAGEVVETGDGVRDLAVGQVVAAVNNAVAGGVGTHAERIALPAADVAPVPEGLSVVEASTVPLNASTAAQALDLFGEARGTLLVTGAAGAVGGYALVLAHDLGFRVTGLARPGDRDFVEGAGAAFTDELPDGFDAVLDAAAIGDAAVGAVRDGGRYVGVLPPAVPKPRRGVTTQAVAVAADGPRLAELLELAAAGRLAPRVAEVRTLEEGPAALAAARSGSRRGRIVLQQ